MDCQNEYHDSYEEEEKLHSDIALKTNLHQSLATRADTLRKTILSNYREFFTNDKAVDQKSPHRKTIVLWIATLDQIEANLKSLLADVVKADAEEQWVNQLRAVYELVVSDLEKANKLNTTVKEKQRNDGSKRP